MVFIERDNKVHVTALSQLFNVTEETVRRDLARLEKDGLLSRTYGGAVSIDQAKEDPSYSIRTAMNLPEKRRIAALAAALINNSDTVMTDASTTAIEAVYALGEKRDLTIITTSLRLAADFTNTSFNIICTGGTIRAHSSSLVGPLALNAVGNYHVDIAIIGCKSISLKSGVMESNEAECELKKRMIEQADKTVLLADHSKFDKASFVKVAEFYEIDYLITDQEPSPVWVEFLKKHHVQLLY